jgi:hypothetical protein
MNPYEKKARHELKIWQKNMLKKPSIFNRLAKNAQKKINSFIPEKIHKVITAAIKQMVRAALFGAEYSKARELQEFSSLKQSEKIIQEKIEFYKKTAAVEGGITGAGGILLGLADFPLLLGLKIKMLFDIAHLYGFDVTSYKERIYILYIFQLAFSSQEQRRKTYLKIAQWEKHSQDLPEKIHDFDWKTFQQEYRDYIDLAKLAQLLPLIGAPVGFIVNRRLMEKLGNTAMNAYRMRLIA